MGEELLHGDTGIRERSTQFFATTIEFLPPRFACLLREIDARCPSRSQVIDVAEATAFLQFLLSLIGNGQEHNVVQRSRFLKRLKIGWRSGKIVGNNKHQTAMVVRQARESL